MPDKKFKDIIEKVNNKAQTDINVSKANELLDSIFQNKYKYMDSDVIFEPSYFQCTLKKKFYDRGGDPLKTYSEIDYANMLDVPVDYILELANTKPQFFLWLHEKRSVAEEMDMLVTVASRRLVNKMATADARNQADILRTLSKFSTAVNPKKEDEENFDDLYDIEQVKDKLKSYGFGKLDEVVSVSDSNSIEKMPTIKDLIGEED